jgi:hypothetical protein
MKSTLEPTIHTSPRYTRFSAVAVALALFLAITPSAWSQDIDECSEPFGDLFGTITDEINISPPKCSTSTTKM